MSKRRKQRSTDSNGRTPDGRFARGNRCGFKPGQSGNPKGRPSSSVEQLELLDRLTSEPNTGYEIAGQMLARKYRRNPEWRISLMEALRLLRDELRGTE